MATITLTFDHPQATFTKAVTLPDNHLVRLMDAFRTYFDRMEKTPNLSNAEIFDKLFAIMATSWRSRVSAEERATAEASAVVAITPISV